MAKKRNTGNPTPYDARDEGMIAAALDQAWQEYEGTEPTGIHVQAQVEWGGVVDRAHAGVRRTRLDGLRLGPVRDALAKVRKAEAAAGKAAPLKLRAKSWGAQYRKLASHGQGAAAMKRAGIDVTPRTLRAWARGAQKPSKANQGKLAAAYDHLRNWRVDKANTERDTARHELADRLSDALRDRYGAEIRLRDISQFDLE